MRVQVAPCTGLSVEPLIGVPDIQAIRKDCNERREEVGESVLCVVISSVGTRVLTLFLRMEAC